MLIHFIHTPFIDNELFLCIRQIGFAVSIYNLLSVFGVLLPFDVDGSFATGNELVGQEVGFGDEWEVAGGINFRGLFVADGFGLRLR